MTTLAGTNPTLRRASLVTLAIALLFALVPPTASHAVEVAPPAGGDSVLVVVPNPGADVAMTAGITSALPSYAGGAGVTIAYLTNGDFVDEATGLIRQGEAVDAQTNFLGRVEDDLIFFGYPDGYLAAVWSTDAPTVWAHPATARTTTYADRGLGLTDWYDYRMGEPADEHADYNKDSMLADMVALIDQRRPDHIFTASEHTANTDYETTAALVDAAVDAVVLADPTYGTTIHSGVVWHPDVALWTAPGQWPADIDPSADNIQDIVANPAASPTLDSVGLLWAAREQFVVPAAMQDTDTDPATSSNPKVLAIDAHATIGGLGDILSRFIHRDEVFWAESMNAPIVSIADASVAEGATAEFTISRTGATNYPVSVTATASDGTAVDPDDYTDPGATLVTIPAGATSATFDVATIDNDIDDGDKTFTVTLTTPSSPATLGDAVAVGTVTDDDTAGVTIDDGSGLTVVEGEATDSYSVVLDSEPTADVVVTVTPDAQLSAVPSSLTFTPANWDTPQDVAVGGVSDDIDEIDPHAGSVSHAATSTDAKYDGISISDAAVAVSDAVGLTVSVNGPTWGAVDIEPTFTAEIVSGGNGTITYAWTVTYDGTQVATGTEATLGFVPTLGGAYTVTVIASDDDGPHDPASLVFNVLTDVGDSIFLDSILWLATEGVTKGCNPSEGNTKFCPGDNVTRGQMAAFLVRFLGLTDDGGGNTFVDDDGSIFEADIAKLAAAGITRGCNPSEGNTKFCPDDFVTREQMAAFLVRALGLTDDGGGNTFVDDDGSIFEADIAKLAAAGITRGCNPSEGNTKFCPDGFVTREQMAAFLQRASALP
jgi:LmbE family N-acetylglucosaminyl deacetylase